MNELFEKSFAGQVRFDEPLSKHSTYKIGGPAKVLLMPESDEKLVEAFSLVKQHDLPYFILGGGSNVLLPDAGFDGVVIKPRNRDFVITEDTFKASAGVMLTKLATETAKAGLTGFEWGIAVPGTLGGAIRGNAGAFGGEIKDTLIEAQVYDGQELKTLSNKELEFSYRTSRIKREKDLIVINATFQLQPGDAAAASAKVKEFLDNKFTQQPMGEPCAGCLFKNVELDSVQTESTEAFKEIPQEFIDRGLIPAGWLIENAGLKGCEQDGIQVSTKHANFLVNTGTGTAQAVKKMARHIKDTVFKKYGLKLEEEVQIVE